MDFAYFKLQSMSPACYKVISGCCYSALPSMSEACGLSLVFPPSVLSGISRTAIFLSKLVRGFEVVGHIPPSGLFRSIEPRTQEGPHKPVCKHAAVPVSATPDTEGVLVAPGARLQCLSRVLKDDSVPESWRDHRRLQSPTSFPRFQLS